MPPLSADTLVALADQLGGDVRAGELVRVRVVDDDVAVARNRGRGVAGQVAQGARQLDGAVFVRIFQAGVHDERWLGALETQFQIFLGDSGDRHGAVL